MHDHGLTKFPKAALLRSSQGRGWYGVAAELRTHPPGELPPFTASQLEMTFALSADPAARVLRRGDGQRQETAVRPGTLWLCPIGVDEDAIRMTAPLYEILHVYLPKERLRSAPEITGGAAVDAASINYVAGVEDDLLRQIAVTVLQELRSETAGGRLLVESLGLTMALRLVNAHSSAPSRKTEPAGRLDGVRLRRVLDYIHSHEDEELTVADLADVACLSQFHFARAFREATGQPPHRYVSARRLEKAKVLLGHTDRPLAQIALECSFSSQANFTRAFRRATGLTPGAYRQLEGRRRLN